MSLAIDPLSPPNHTPPNCNKFFLQQTSKWQQISSSSSSSKPQPIHTHKLFHKCFVFCHHGHPAILNQMPLLPPQLSSPKPHEVLKFEPPCLSHFTEGLLTPDLCPNAAPLQIFQTHLSLCHTGIMLECQILWTRELSEKSPSLHPVS